MSVQLVPDEVYVATGEPWVHRFDDRSWERIRELVHPCGWEGAVLLAGGLLRRWS